jgi:GrpB-like predicted nucleotidyltransferase (UPF0157 family)
MLGLKRGTVRVVPSDTGWREAFVGEKSSLQQRLGSLVLDIQHVGSTAVPGLAAKPILDLAIAIAPEQPIAPLRPPLVALGYLDRGDGGAHGGYLFVKEIVPEVRSHHVHIVAVTDPQWRWYLFFRDRLRSDQVLCSEYAALKQSLARRFAHDRDGYTQAKHDFIRRVLAACPR